MSMDFYLPLELVSIIVLLALIGAIAMARKLGLEIKNQRK